MKGIRVNYFHVQGYGAQLNFISYVLKICVLYTRVCMTRCLSWIIFNYAVFGGKCKITKMNGLPKMN